MFLFADMQSLIVMRRYYFVHYLVPSTLLIDALLVACNIVG